MFITAFPNASGTNKAAAIAVAIDIIGVILKTTDVVLLITKSFLINLTKSNMG